MGLRAVIAAFGPDVASKVARPGPTAPASWARESCATPGHSPTGSRSGPALRAASLKPIRAPARASDPANAAGVCAAGDNKSVR